MTGERIKTRSSRTRYNQNGNNGFKPVSTFINNTQQLTDLPESDHDITILDALADGIVITDDDGQITYANPHMEILFGWTRQELVGQPIDILLQPESREKHRELFRGYLLQPKGRMLGGGNSLGGLRKDGTTFPIEVSINPYNLNGHIQIISLIRDISRRVMTIDQLQDSLKRFESLYNAFPLPVYVWKYQQDDFFLVDYNHADLPQVNQAVQRLLGRSLRLIWNDDERMPLDIQQCLQERSSFSTEYKGYRVPFTNKVKDLKVTFVFCEPDLVMVIYNDLTRLNNTADELKKLSSAVEQTADAVFITDRNGIIEYANQGFELMTGYPREEAVGNNPRIIKSGQMPAEYFDTLWKTVLAGEVFKSQTINRRQNGEVFIAEQTITPMKAPDGEITHFVSVLKDMTDRIRSQELQTEHRLAGRIQEQLFPRNLPNIPGYDIAGAVFPAKYTSGDYFDFIHLSKHRLGIAVADVCDHSLGSAIVMAKTQAHLRSIMQYETNPRDVLVKLNRQMHPDMPDAMFITMFLAILDPVRHTLENANAGNTPTLILDRDGKILYELKTDGFPVGIFRDMKLKPRVPILLPEGSVCVFLTDGITEAFDPLGEQFGLDGLIGVIQKNIRASASEMIERVREAVQAFSGTSEAADDQTIIVCKRVD